jgi:hypothetical protein
MVAEAVAMAVLHDDLLADCARWLLWPADPSAAGAGAPASAVLRGKQARTALAVLALLNQAAGPDVGDADAFVEGLSWAPEGPRACAARLAGLAWSSGPSQAVAEGLVLMRSLLERAAETAALGRPAWLDAPARPLPAAPLSGEAAREVCAHLGSCLGRLPGVAAVCRVRRLAPTTPPALSVSVLVEGAPPPELRAAAIGEVADSADLLLQRDRADTFPAGGTPVDVTYAPLSDLLGALEAEEGLPPDAPALLSAVQGARPLHDPDGLLLEMEAALDDMPRELLRELAGRLGAGAGVALEALAQAVRNNNPIASGILLGDAAAALCRTVCSGNRFFPTEDDLTCACAFEPLAAKPDRFFERLSVVCGSAGDRPAFVELLRELTALRAEAEDLIR